MKNSKIFLLAIILLQLATIAFLIYDSRNNDFQHEPAIQFIEKNGGIGIDAVASNRTMAFDSSYPWAGLYLKNQDGDFFNLSGMTERLTRCYNTDNEKIPKDHFKVKVEIKGEKIIVPRFSLNGLNYSNSRGCFKDRPKSKIMENYIPIIHTDTLIPFKFKVLSPNKEPNEVKLKITFYNSSNTEIAKFPKDGSSHTEELTDISMVKTIEGFIPIPSIELPKPPPNDDTPDSTDPILKESTK